MSDLVGETVGQYQIIEEIGRGGMAVVYKAWQPSLQRHVALKVLPPQFTFDAQFLARFQREARAAAQFSHPNIVAIYDTGAVDGLHYIAMEYLEGQTLKQLVAQQGPLPPARVARIVEQIASALDYAHQQGFVHRDVKPSNLFVGQDGHATLTDFGIAMAASGARLTKTGMVVGTPEYMSPEQARGQAVDYRTDVYALGVVAYEMLSGRPPFQGDTLAVLHAHAYETPPPLHAHNPVLPRGLDRVMGKALVKNPGDRYVTAGALAEALARAAGKGQTRAAAHEPSTMMAVHVVQPSLKGAAAEPVSTASALRTQPSATGRAWQWLVTGLAALAVLVVIALVAGSEGRDSASRSSAAGDASVASAVARAEETTTAKAVSTRGLPPPAMTPTAMAASPPRTATHTPTASPTPSGTSTATGTPQPTSTPTATPTLSPQPSATPTSTPEPLGVVSEGPVNLRAGPGTMYEVVGIVQQGNRVRLLAQNQSGEWLQVDPPGQLSKAWIWADFVELNMPQEILALASDVPPRPTSTPTLSAAQATRYFPLEVGRVYVYGWRNSVYRPDAQIETIKLAERSGRQYTFEVASDQANGFLKLVREQDALAWFRISVWGSCPHPLNMCTILDYVYTTNYFLREPLIPGHSWEGTSPHPVDQSSVSIVAANDETVTVPAGTFSDCLRIHSRLESEHSYLAGSRDIWFAVDVGLIKLVYNHRDGSVTVAELQSVSQ